MEVLIITKDGGTLIDGVEEISITSTEKGLIVKSHEDKTGWGWNITEKEEER